MSKRRGVDDFLSDVRKLGRAPQRGGAVPIGHHHIAAYEQDELHGTANEAIAFAIELGMEAGSFLSIWREGSWKTMHLEWPGFPAQVRVAVQPRASRRTDRK